MTSSERARGVWGLLSVCAVACVAGCESPSAKSDPTLLIDPAELLVALPAELGAVAEGSVQLRNTGRVDVMIVDLVLTEEVETPELTLLDAEDWQGRVTIRPGEARSLRVRWNSLDTQADRDL